MEPSEVSAAGRIMVARHVISTPVRKLLKQGAISVIEAEAARLLSSDHDAALAGSRSILAAAGERVDGGRNNLCGVDLKFQRLDRYRRALRHLRNDLACIAYAAIVEGACSTIPRTYQGVGGSLLPHGSVAEQTGAGKAAIVLTVRELAVFYGLRRAG